MAQYAENILPSTTGYDLGSDSQRWDGWFQTFDLGGIKLLVGTGTPESVVSAPQGSLFLRTDGSTSTTLYIKTSGSGSTGWTAK